jgi:transformation/transcription domain-associated protein
MLERRMIEEGLQPTTDKSMDELNTAIVRQLYLDLGEKDIWLHLKSMKSANQSSKLAVSLDLYGRVEAALDTYSDLIESSQHELNKMIGDLCRNLDPDISLWEDRWIALNRELIQWPLLSDIADNGSMTKLSTECAWKCREFDKLRTICSSMTGIAAFENGDIEQKMSEIFLAFNDGNIRSGDIENLHAQTSQLCLYKWQLLPELYASCQAHSHLLHQFHRLIEMRESGQLITDISSYISARTIPESPKTLMNVWRSRLPSDFDSITWWDDIFQWRTHLFNIISNSFCWTEQATLATLHDRPWTAIRQAVLARKHGVKDVALFSLSHLTDMAMDVNDAYSKLREQILTYKDGTEIERTCGLNLINTTNLSYFDAPQKSELFRLKAEFLDGLGSRSKASGAYCHSVQICPTSSRSWSSWGDLCWSLYRCTDKPDQDIDEAKDVKDSTSQTKQGVQYMAQAMGCYLEAINCDACEWSRLNLPKCLVMLAKDVSPHGALFQTFDKYGLNLPPWVFLMWIPQILSGLCRMEGRAMKALLNKILLTYPQAVYFPLRAFYLERRDAERSRTSPEGLQHESINHADELMTSFRKAHPTLWTSLETILEELILRFRPTHEEELLATMTALLQRAEYQLEHQRRPGENDDGAIRASFKKTLSRISSKFFELPTSDGKTFKKIKIFIDRYKASFDADFTDYDTGENFRLQLPDIYAKLQKWKVLLEKQVALTPSSVPLVTISHILSSYCSSAPDLWPGSCDPLSLSPVKNQDEWNTDTSTIVLPPSASAKVISNVAMNASRALLAASKFEGNGGQGSAVVEIPGQYSPNNSHDSKPAPELHNKLMRFDGNIQVMFRSGQLARKIGLVGSDGKVYTFLLQFAVPYWTKTDERTTQIHHLFGALLRRDKNSSRRNLWLRPCPAIPIAQRLRMIYEDDAHVSLEEIYLMDMQRKGMDPSLVNQMFQNEVRKRFESLDPSTDELITRSVKLEAFQEVCRHVDDNILSDYIHRVFARDAESLFKFRKVFTAQLAMNSLLQYAFDANDRSPSKFMFSVKTGQVLAPDFRFSYSNQGRFFFILDLWFPLHVS